MPDSIEPRISVEESPLDLAMLGDVQKVLDQHAIISIADVTGSITYVNDRFCEVSGYSREELIGANHRMVKSAAHGPAFFEAMWRTIAQGGTWQGNVENRRKDGSPYWVKTTIMPVLDEQGKPKHYISIRTDVTQQFQTEEVLRKFKHILDQTLDSVFIFDAETLLIRYVNLGAVRQIGYTENELLDMTPVDFKPKFDEQMFHAMLLPLLNGEEQSHIFETVHQHKDGALISVEIFMQYFPESDGAGQFIAIVRDISERQRTSAALESLATADPEKNVFHSIARSVAEALNVRWVGVAEVSENSDIVQMMGFWDGDHEGALVTFPMRGTPCEEICRKRRFLMIPEHVAELYPNAPALEYMGASSYRGAPLLNSLGHEIGVLFAIDDKPGEDVATDRALMLIAAKRAALELQRQQAEQVAQKHHHQLYETLERVSDGFFSLDEQWCFTYINSSAAKVFKATWHELKGKCIWAVLPDVSDYFRPHLHKAMREQRRVWVEEFTPSDCCLSLYVYPDQEGLSVYIQDITEYQQLKKKHQHVEIQAQQSQKMEAIGHLTAGIAHDFNNILASINGYTDLALTRCVGEGQEKLQEYLGQVYKAGERARDLIQQMMTYSRTDLAGESAMDPRLLIKETVKLMYSSLPASIVFNVDFSDEPQFMISMNPGQLQQMIMNLCVNARDAMQGKGEITIALSIEYTVLEDCASCYKHAGGDYVVLSVQDTGVGLADDAVQHLFEPFFTTKDVGAGTGLGLSVLHGIMHEYEGHIRVVSTLGLGTTFSLLFPLLQGDKKQPVALIAAAEEKNIPAVLAKKRYILLVDDEPAVLGFLYDWLEGVGFSVVAFQHSEEALCYLDTHVAEVALLITDQTMPQLTGTELIEKALILSPQLPTILCSGYSNVDGAFLKNTDRHYFAEKPFQRKLLLNAIENLLANNGFL
jgi:PAS domain S-box-containing protein